MTRRQKTVENFETMNCNQAVLAAIGPDFGLSEDLCYKVGLSFGGGMGRQGKTCGAVTGAYIAIGLWSARQTDDKQLQKQVAAAKVQEFNKQFQDAFGSLECKSLLKYDLSVEYEATEAKELGLFDSLCPIFVGSSTEILEQILY